MAEVTKEELRAELGAASVELRQLAAEVALKQQAAEHYKARAEAAEDPQREQTWAERFRVLTARAEEAERDVEHERQMRAIMATTITNAESECAALRAKLLDREEKFVAKHAELVAVETRLAAATETMSAIRGYMHARLADGTFILKGPNAQRVRDLLAPQPAALVRTDFCAACMSPNGFCLCPSERTAPDRIEADSNQDVFPGMPPAGWR